MHLLRRELAVLAGRDASFYSAGELGFIVVIVPELDEILVQFIVSLVLLLLLYPRIVERLPVVKVDTEILKHLLEDMGVGTRCMPRDDEEDSVICHCSLYMQVVHSDKDVASLVKFLVELEETLLAVASVGIDTDELAEDKCVVLAVLLIYGSLQGLRIPFLVRHSKILALDIHLSVHRLDLIGRHLTIADAFAHERAVDIATEGCNELDSLQLLGVGLQCTSGKTELEHIEEYIRGKPLDIVRPRPHSLTATERLLLCIEMSGQESLPCLGKIIVPLLLGLGVDCELVVVRWILQVDLVFGVGTEGIRNGRHVERAEHHCHLAKVVVGNKGDLLSGTCTSCVAVSLDSRILPHCGSRLPQVEGNLLRESLIGVIIEAVSLAGLRVFVLAILVLLDCELLDPGVKRALRDNIKCSLVLHIQSISLLLKFINLLLGSLARHGQGLADVINLLKDILYVLLRCRDCTCVLVVQGFLLVEFLDPHGNLLLPLLLCQFGRVGKPVSVLPLSVNHHGCVSSVVDVT